MRFLLVILLGISLGQLTGCSGGGDEPPLESTKADDYYQEQSSQKISLIDGYKDFKFGMKYGEVVNSPMLKEEIYIMGVKSGISFYSGGKILFEWEEGHKELPIDKVEISVPFTSSTLKGVLESLTDKYEFNSSPSSAELEGYDNYTPKPDGPWSMMYNCPKIYWYFANCQVSVNVNKWRGTDYSDHQDIHIFYQSPEVASKECDELNAKSRSNSSSL